MELLIWWNDWKLKPEKNIIWDWIPVALMRTIWNARNKLIFEESQPNWEDIIELMKVRVALWVKTKLGGGDYTVDDFVFKLKSILESL